jgi:TM2 domain-containing membrane protein YozV
MGGAFSTYWDFTGKEKFYLHGLGFSLATIPLFWCGVPWWILLIHGIVCIAGMGWISEKSDTDWVEEFSRGVFYIL